MTIVVFGELNLDIFFSFKDISRAEELNFQLPYEYLEGGKGANHAVAAAKAGGDVKMIGKVGNDFAGNQLVNSLKKYNVNTDSVSSTSASPTCYVLLSKEEALFNYGMLAADNANNLLTIHDITSETLNGASFFITHFTSNSESIIEGINLAHSRGIDVIFNVSPFIEFNIEILHKVSLVIVNEDEAHEIAKLANFKPNSIEDLAYKFAKTYNNDWVITLGSKGSIAYYNHTLWTIDAYPIKVVDTTGAGDTFLGYMATTLDKGGNFSYAMKLANIASSLTCNKLGTQTVMPNIEEVITLYNQAPDPIDITHSIIEDICILGIDDFYHI
jgi:ribokinase